MISLPKSMQNAANRAFAGFFGIDTSEAEFGLSSYESIQAVFTRRLKPGSRKIESSVCSPADGVLTMSSALSGNIPDLRVKGHDYPIDQLVFGSSKSQLSTADLGWYQVVYLAPHNYHRVHSPVSGKIRMIRHIPGELWSVSPRLLKYVPKLFCRNERVVFEIEVGVQQVVYVVMVGAMNVGTISTRFLPGFVSNRFGASFSEHPIRDGSVAAGEEIGIFHLGSTVVCVYPNDFSQKHSFVQTNQNIPILMGQSLIQH